jgi:hypothetical protein
MVKGAPPLAAINAWRRSRNIGDKREKPSLGKTDKEMASSSLA